MTTKIEKWIEERTPNFMTDSNHDFVSNDKMKDAYRNGARAATKYILEELGVLECLTRFKLGQWPDGRYLSARQSEVLAKETLEKLTGDV